MRVLYWNCTSPGGADNTFAEAKIAMIAARIVALKPDIVCLDEVSEKLNTVAMAQAYANGYGVAPAAFGASYTAKSVSLNPGTHLNQAVFFANAAPAGLKVAEGIPDSQWDDDKTRRNLSRVTWQEPKTLRLIYIWFLHANASDSGGKLAVELALTATKGVNAVFIGDFNSSALNAVVTARDYSKCVAVPPVAPGVKGVAFTQWSRALSGVQSVADYKITGTTYDFKPSPKGCIDFALASGLVDVVAADALAGLNANEVGQLMMNMDHFPVLYDITARAG